MRPPVGNYTAALQKVRTAARHLGELKVEAEKLEDRGMVKTITEISYMLEILDKHCEQQLNPNPKEKDGEDTSVHPV